MWSATHIQVTVQRAKGLLTKGKNGTNNCFVTISLGKEKYQTSIKEKSICDIDWHEECELTIPERGNRAELILTCLHRNNLQLDEFLGQITIPLNEMDAYDRPRAKWFKLQSKPGKDKKDKDRGELEVRIAFTVKAGSLTDLSKKDKSKSSLGLGGSLLSIGTLEKRKSLKKFAKSLGSKVHIGGKSKKDKDKGSDSESFTGSVSSIGTPGSAAFQPRRFGKLDERNNDPGFISEDEDEFVFDNLSHKSSGSSLNIKSNTTQQLPPTTPSPMAIPKKPPTLSPPTSPTITITAANDEVRLRSKTLPPSKPPRITTAETPSQVDEWEAKLYGGGKHLELGGSDALKRRSWESSRVPLSVQNEIDEIIEKQTLHVPNGGLPNLDDTKENENEIEIKPKPLPRSSTLECIIEKDKDVEKSEEKMEIIEKKPEKRFSKYFRKDKTASTEDLRRASQKQFGERIIIGHENEIRLIGKPIEVSQNILKKYEGKTREEIMLIANDYENEVKLQKLKMKEMEDYLDNLLLRVMETQPKLLQNPYRDQTSTKSG